MNTVRIGTRGSALALAQAKTVQQALATRWPEIDFTLQILKTSGEAWSARSDEQLRKPDKGFFTREFEEGLRAGTIDLAVHSLKDLPTEETAGLTVAAIPERADARDVLILHAGSLAALPSGAIIATGSNRRAAQLLFLRPDLKIAPIRGNVDTRLRKLRENPIWAGTVLAAAGLDRLGADLTGLVREPFEVEQMLPAPGQGALGLQIREDDPFLLARVAALDHAPTRAAVTAERAFLRGLGGGCQAPVGAYGSIENGTLLLHGIAWLNGESTPRRGSLSGKPEEAAALGHALAKQIAP